MTASKHPSFPPELTLDPVATGLAIGLPDAIARLGHRARSDPGPLGGSAFSLAEIALP